MSTNNIIDNDYVDLINTLKSTVQTAQLRAHRKVNAEEIGMLGKKRFSLTIKTGVCIDLPQRVCVIIKTGVCIDFP